MATIANPVKWLTDFLSGRLNGPVSVNEKTVTGIPAVWYAVNRIGNNFSQLPFQPLMRLAGGGAEPAIDHVSYIPCKHRANAFMNSGTFRQKIITDALLWGDGRAAIVPGGREYIPLDPRCTITLLSQGEKYHVTLPNPDDRILNWASFADTAADRDLMLMEYFFYNKEKTITLMDSQVLHLMGFSFNGISGCSVLELCRQTFETALTSRKHLNKQWEKGFTGRLMLEAPQGALRQEQDAKEFFENFKKAHSVSGDNETIGLLREGIKANVITMSGRDAQWVEQMNDSRRDVALIFMLESILGDDQSVSYNSLAEKNLAFLTNCLHNWLHRWEQECWSKLLSESERRNDSHFYKFNTGALLKTDIKTTMETLSLAIQSRILNPNEARAKLDENPYDGGDVYQNPAIDTLPAEPQESADGQAIESRIRHMIGVETKRVCDGAKSKNYVNWIDGFYDRWKGTFADVVAECGGERIEAIRHCDESKEILLNAIGGVTAADLSKAVSEVTSSWADRATKITATIKKGVTHV